MKLGSVKKQKIGDDYNSIILEQWKTCVEMANSNTEKRANSNNIYITINSALLTVATFTLDYKSIMLSVVGVVVCILWMNSIESYKKLSSVKYHIVNEIEERLPLAPFTYEWDKLKTEQKYIGLTKIEKILPCLFLVLFSISIIWPIFKVICSLTCQTK